MRILTLLVVAITSGCAIAPQQKGWTIDDAMAEAPIICSGKSQCDDYWRRTQYWISTHSGFKVQVATDTVIETYGAPNYSLRWAFSARREPGPNGADMITISPSCGPAPICQESRVQLVRDAQRYISSN